MIVLDRYGNLKRISQNIPLEALEELRTLLEQLASIDWTPLADLGSELASVDWLSYSNQLAQLLNSLSMQTQVEPEMGSPPPQIL